MKVAIKYKVLTCELDGSLDPHYMFLTEFAFDPDDKIHAPTNSSSSRADAFVFDLTKKRDYELVKELVRDFNVPDGLPEPCEMQIVGAELILVDFEIEPPSAPIPLRLVKHNREQNQ